MISEYEFLLNDRIQKIQSINDLYDLENKSYISFSGGKDSIVLSKLIDIALPNNNIPRVFINTGIEYNNIIDNIKKNKEKDSRILIRNARVNIPQMLREYGYPFKSKDFAGKVQAFQNNHFTTTPFLDKYLQRPQDAFGCPPKLRYCFSKNFTLKVSDRCCYFLKKKPLLYYQKESGRHCAIVGLKKSDGGRRSVISGCVFFDKKDRSLKKFFPLFPCDDKWELDFCKNYKIELPQIYKYFSRTGCKGCPFAIDLQKQLDILRIYSPNEYHQCEQIWQPIYAEYRRINYRLKSQLEFDF